MSRCSSGQVGGVRNDAYVYNHNTSTCLAGQDVYSSPAPQKGLDHLAGHLLGICADSLRRNAVVPSHNQNSFIFDRRLHGSLYAANPLSDHVQLS